MWCHNRHFDLLYNAIDYIQIHKCRIFKVNRSQDFVIARNLNGRNLWWKMLCHIIFLYVSWVLLIDILLHYAKIVQWKKKKGWRQVLPVSGRRLEIGREIWIFGDIKEVTVNRENYFPTPHGPVYIPWVTSGVTSRSIAFNT